MLDLFRRRHSPTPSGLPLPVLNNSGDSALHAKLRSELRHCPTCGYEVSNPMTDRCPRCFALVPLSEHTNCGECSHQGNCAFHQMEK